MSIYFFAPTQMRKYDITTLFSISEQMVCSLLFLWFNIIHLQIANPRLLFFYITWWNWTTLFRESESRRTINQLYMFKESNLSATFLVLFDQVYTNNKYVNRLKKKLLSHLSHSHFLHHAPKFLSTTQTLVPYSIFYSSKSIHHS